MADSEWTKEQKLVFCLAKAVEESRVTLKASQILAVLAQRGILRNLSPPQSYLSPPLSPPLSLLGHLFRIWSRQRCSPRERALQFRTFQSAIAESESSGDVFGRHLPNIDGDDAEVDGLFNRLKKTRCPPGFEFAQTPRVTLAFLDTAQCRDALRETFHHNKSDCEVLRALFASMTSVESERRRLAFLHTLATGKEATCPSRSLQQMSLLRNILEKASGVFDKLKKMASVASKNTKAKPSPQIRDHYEVLLCKFAYGEVGRYWKRLGVFLGFSLSELNGIEQHSVTRGLTVGEMAWSMIDKYRNDKGKDQASIEKLRALLSDVHSSTVKVDADVTIDFSSFEIDRLQEGQAVRSHSCTLLKENFVLFFECLRNHPRILVLFDNADQLELLRDALPKPHICCHVLITTRRVKTQELCSEPNVRMVKLDTLKEESAILALLKWAGKNPEEFREMKEEEKEFVRKVALDPPVEGLPLALAHAGISIERQSSTFESYWRQLRAKAKDLDPAALTFEKCLQYFHLSHLKELLQEVEVFTPEDLACVDVTELKVESHNERLICRAKEALKRKRRLYLTWELDIDYIRKQSKEEAYRLLRYCSFFAFQNIPQEVVRDAAFSDTEEEFRDVVMAKAVLILKEHSFLQQTDLNDLKTVYAMHHLIQASVLGPLMGDENVCREMLNSVGRCLVDRLPPESEIFGSPVVVSLLPHVHSVAMKLLEVRGIGRNSSKIVQSACFLLIQFSHFEMAKKLCEKRIKLFTEPPNSASEDEKREWYRNMCTISDQLCDFESVKTYAELALCGRSPEELSDKEIVYSFFFIVNNLAWTYVSTELLSEAEKLDQRLLKAISSYPKAEKLYFSACCLLESIYNYKGEYEKELKFLEKAERFLSEDNLEMASYCFSCGRALCYLGRFSEAHDYVLKAIRIYKIFALETNSRMADVLRLNSMCYRNFGNFSKAIEMSKEALAIARCSYPPGNKELSQYLGCHAENMAAVGKRRISIELLKQALSTMQMDSPTCRLKKEMFCYSLLIGAYLMGREDFEAAIPYLRNCVSWGEELHRSKDNDINTLVWRYLGACYMKTGLYQEALPFVQRSAFAYKELLEDNSIAVAEIHDYIGCLIHSKKFDEAETEIFETPQLYSHLPQEHSLFCQLNNLYGVLCKRRV